MSTPTTSASESDKTIATTSSASNRTLDITKIAWPVKKHERRDRKCWQGPDVNRGRIQKSNYDCENPYHRSCTETKHNLQRPLGCFQYRLTNDDPTAEATTLTLGEDCAKEHLPDEDLRNRIDQISFGGIVNDAIRETQYFDSVLDMVITQRKDVTEEEYRRKLDQCVEISMRTFKDQEGVFRRPWGVIKAKDVVEERVQSNTGSSSVQSGSVE
ncbi:hypothetical protein CI109_100316 [Kwoniella shandongensis]|uniref:Uncharacterized protein n=1 Tax=Kwoniella shandongensis TaxID=1734106 RepID=A0A5M6C423_9TREE|nr:uncharacterized protein CI109_001838 [Kwoniella shandongensis]KAA5529898.1 hypothetical protein CI109_001838 [Kwoniella shandongensis]